jgi:hypothetical protein
VLSGAAEKPILDADTIAAGDESARHRRALNGRRYRHVGAVRVSSGAEWPPLLFRAMTTMEFQKWPSAAVQSSRCY